MLFDERSKIRDEILKWFPKTNFRVYYHVIAWALFIAYEVSLSGVFRGSYNHFSDYFFHYLLYILLFYVHCYLVLRSFSLRRIASYGKLLLYIFLEFALYYGCNVLINRYLQSAEWTAVLTGPSDLQFNLATLYRFIYIAGLSTAYRITLNLLASQKRNYEFLTEQLIREKDIEFLRAELATAELSRLRSKVSPHFLSNSLTSVYNRVRKIDTNIAEYVMALAEVMRYAFQPETDVDEIALESELEHISSYVKVQEMRYSTDIDLTINVDDLDLRIAPLLLITIVENIYMHGDLKNTKCRPLIEITAADGELELRTKNWIRRDPNPGNGMGLVNVRERLDRQYKNRFEFEYGADGDIFNVKLKVKLR